MTKQLKIIFLFAISAITFLLFKGQITQISNYHNFADTVYFCEIPNFKNVVSNLFFLLAGLYAILYKDKYAKAMGACLFMLFAGSVYYHLNPNDQTLIGDRLFIAAFFSMLFIRILTILNIIGDCSTTKNVSILYVIVATMSVIVWQLTGDLRMYAFAQFFPLVCLVCLIPYAWVHYRKQAIAMVLLIVSYAIAKVFEFHDYELMTMTNGWISGHTAKHTVAGLGLLMYFVKE
jgi:hypothetical protein